MVGSGTVPFTGFTVTDRIEGNLTYLDSTSLGPDFTGRIDGKTLGANYDVTVLINSQDGYTDLTRKVKMLGDNKFETTDQFIVKIMAKVKGSQTNTGIVQYPVP